MDDLPTLLQELDEAKATLARIRRSGKSGFSAGDRSTQYMTMDEVRREIATIESKIQELQRLPTATRSYVRIRRDR